LENIISMELMMKKKNSKKLIENIENAKAFCFSMAVKEYRISMVIRRSVLTQHIKQIGDKNNV